jgi:hypothetical protein
MVIGPPSFHSSCTYLTALTISSGVRPPKLATDPMNKLENDYAGDGLTSLKRLGAQNLQVCITDWVARARV